ncbi:MAG TPA: RNA polymerase sigma factor [Actinomycetota bacterium]|nr:RNA polymerase sigma factor [Actinomycetota bacterium]
MAGAAPARVRVEPPLEVAADFESFYEIESARLFGALCLICGNRHDAEELMQEAFLRVWERWGVVQGLASPTGYLYRTAMNAFRMRRRRLAVAARRFVRREARDDLFDQADARYLVDRGLAGLTPRQRAAVVLTELLGYSSGEAAESLGVKPETVRKLAQLGRDSLRRTLGDTDG